MMGGGRMSKNNYSHNFMSTRTSGRPKKNRRKDDNEEPIGGRQGWWIKLIV